MAETNQGQTSAGQTGPGGEVSKDAKTFAMLCHLLGIFTGFLGPLIIWLVKKNDDKFIDDQGKEALNFQITFIIAWIVGVISIFLCIGFILLPIIWVLDLIFCIMGAVKANNGELYRYPINLRLIK
jgi:uncharacterized Tic20 family protein